MVRAFHLAGLAGLLLVSPALAQSEGELPEKADRADIVVSAELPTWTQTTRQARAVTVPTGLRYLPLPRFEGDRLCPGVIGLKADYAALVVDRIRANAERFDLWMTDDDGTCQPNFIVAFVDDGQDTLQRIADRRRWLFTEMPRPERLALLAEDGPARVWTTTATRTRDGMPGSEDPSTRIQSVGMWEAHSKIYIPVREDITGVLVLFDRAAVRGKTLAQLADYATMRGLARTRSAEGDGPALDTILTLFDPDATPPAELTAFDRAYLGALYDGMPNLPGLTKIQSVNRQLRRQARAEAAAAGE